MSDGELLERFIVQEDEAAFETLVRRYGPMVFRVCREILPRPHDAEDAFQATFLVLVRNAEAIRDRQALGRWLYGVAYRVAVRSKAHSARVSFQEPQRMEMTVAEPDPDVHEREHRHLLHEELNRLPEKFRVPLILCYMEGQTVEVAARQIQCPLGTFKGRLARGRELLRSRLVRRGVVIGSSFLMLLLSKPGIAEPSELSELSEELIRTTVEAGVLLASGVSAGAVTTPQISTLLAEELEFVSIANNWQAVSILARWWRPVATSLVLVGLLSLALSLTLPRMAASVQFQTTVDALTPAPASAPDVASIPNPLTASDCSLELAEPVLPAEPRSCLVP